MATKKQTWEAAVAVMNKYELPAEAVSELTALLEPKAGGKVLDISEVTREEDGVIVAILDSVTNLWLPADADTFYEDKSGKGIEVDGVALKRVSKLGYSATSKHKKAVAASKEAIFSDVLEGVISPEEGKDLVLELEETGPDFSELDEIALEVA